MAQNGPLRAWLPVSCVTLGKQLDPSVSVILLEKKNNAHLLYFVSLRNTPKENIVSLEVSQVSKCGKVEGLGQGHESRQGLWVPREATRSLRLGAVWPKARGLLSSALSAPYLSPSLSHLTHQNTFKLQ